jgi:peptidyl-prolyl cis-trans isomerase B (cyclophilin B)
MLRLLALLLLCALLAGACGGDDSSDEAAATGTPASTCDAAEAPEPKVEGSLAKPEARLDGSKTYVATVSTNCGDFEITLDAKQAPRTGG